METKEILEVLYQMRNDWQKSIGLEYDLIDINVSLGFCMYLRRTNLQLFINVLDELKRDRIEFIHSEEDYFYPTLCSVSLESESNQNEIDEILMYRIDHLNRTITRLELQQNSTTHGN